VRVQTYRDLDVWKKSISLAEEIYQLTRLFPDDEKFGLTSQIRRAAVSVPANIAEGYGRTHRGDYLHHLSIARGSLTEVETHLIIAKRPGFIAEEQAIESWNLAQDIGKMLNKLIASLKDPPAGTRTPESGTRN
jgi:four helix bundle protein